MDAEHRLIPPGPTEAYDTTVGLLDWMAENFDRFGDIYKASIYSTDAYVIRDPHYVQHVLQRNWQNYKKGQVIKRVALLLGNGLMVSEGEFWKKQRRMIQPAFLQKAIADLTAAIVAANLALLEAWEQAALDDRSVNVTRDISLMVLEVVLISIFGEDHVDVAPHFSILSDETSRDLRFAQAFRALGDLVIRAAARRRKEGRISTDILGMLMEARDRDSGQTMSDRQLVSEIMTLIVAGHETTASSLNMTWYLLSGHPEVDEKLFDELDRLMGDRFPKPDELPKFIYTRQVLEEVQRLYPPGWLMTRKALNDDHLGDYHVPAGTEIYVPPYFIHRHPKVWESPDAFDPDRFAPDRSSGRHAMAMLPFSAGPRNCIGEFLARTEMQIHLMAIGKRLRLCYIGGRKLELEAGVNLRSVHDFMMVPELRNHSPNANSPLPS